MSTPHPSIPSIPISDERDGPSVHTRHAVDVSFEQMGSIAGSEGFNALLQASYSAFNMLPDATQSSLVNQEQGGGGGSGGRDPNANMLAKGDRIEIPWGMSEGEDFWYAGCVSAVTAAHISVQYDDDDGEPPVRYEKAQMEHGTTWRFCEMHVRGDYGQDDGLLPEGWRVETRTRQGGKTAGTRDKYYMAPDGKRCRSMPEVQRHIDKAARKDEGRGWDIEEVAAGAFEQEQGGGGMSKVAYPRPTTMQVAANVGGDGTTQKCAGAMDMVRAVSPCSATGFPGFPGCGGGGGGGDGGVDGDGGGSDYGDGQDMEAEVLSVGEWSSRLQVLSKPTYPASVMAAWGMVEGPTPSPSATPRLSAPPPASQQQLETTKRNTKRTRTAFTQNDFVRASVGRKGGPDVRVWLLKKHIGGGMGGKFMNSEMKAILIKHVQYVLQKTGINYVVGLPAEVKKQTTLRSAQQLVVFLEANMRQVGSEANHVHKAGRGHGAGGGSSGSNSSTAEEVGVVRVAPAFLVCECQHAKAIPWVSATTCYYGIRGVDFDAAGLDSREASKRRCELNKKTQKRSKGAEGANAQNGKRVKAALTSSTTINNR